LHLALHLVYTRRVSVTPVRIGQLQISQPFCQAGLAGYSDRAMRNVARRRGCPYAVTEAMLDTLMLAGGWGLKNAIDIDGEDHPVAGQVIGSEPDTMARAAKIFAEHDYDVVDLNFACPVKKIKNKARGGHMLRDVPRGHAILRAVREMLPSKTLSVSLRRAFDDSPQNREALFELVDEMWQLGYASVRVHGRTVEQKYAGKADWKILAELKRRYPTQIIFGSGDVFTAQDAVRMKQQTGVDVVWVARGAIGNPWIFRDAAKLLADPDTALVAPTIAEQRQALSEHFAIAMEIHGESLAGRRMRKMGIKYARFHPQAREVKNGFIEVKGLKNWQDVLDRHYAVDGPGVWPREDAVDEVNAGEATDGCGIGE
jgi:tRNA-dihydrouridine synthase B